MCQQRLALYVANAPKVKADVGVKNMKKRYFIPLFVVSAIFLIFLNTVLLGIMASWSFNFMRHEFGIGNLIITRGLAMLASILTATLAVPLAIVSRKSNSLYGVALAIIGLMVIINPINGDVISMLRTLYPEYLTYILTCWIFWMLGNKLTKEKWKPQQSTATTTS